MAELLSATDIRAALQVDTGETIITQKSYYWTLDNPTEIVLSGVYEVIEHTDITSYEDGTDAEGKPVQVEVKTPTITTHQMVYSRADKGDDIVQELPLDSVLTHRPDKNQMVNAEGDIINYTFRLLITEEEPVINGQLLTDSKGNALKAE